MIYLDADNNLGDASLLDLEEMQAVGSTSNVTVIVQHDTNGGTTKRYKVEKGSLSLLADLGELDMSDGATLRDFVASTVVSYPAEHYALIIWNHGQGWKSASQAVATKSIFNDYDNGNPSNYLSNYYVANALADAGSLTGVKLDILGIDACEMSVIESAYEFRNVADILVASQELVSAYGWDYDNLLSRLVLNPGLTPVGFSKAMVDSFKKFYSGSVFTDQTITALTLTEKYSSDGASDIGTVAQEVNALALKLSSLMADSGTRSATLNLLTNSRATVQEFDEESQPSTYVDLVDLSRNLEGGDSLVEQAFNKILLKEYHGPDRPNAYGLSIVFYDRSSPYDWYVYDSNYRNYDPATGTGSRIAFLNDFNWDEMLHAYYGYQYPGKPN
jgi:hypothetical protein